MDESVIARPNRSPLNTMMHGQQLDVGGDFADTATLQQRAELGANVATGVGESTDSYPHIPTSQHEGPGIAKDVNARVQ